jgi:hypothetical protein
MVGGLFLVMATAYVAHFFVSRHAADALRVVWLVALAAEAVTVVVATKLRR